MIPFDFVHGLLPELILTGIAVILLIYGAYFNSAKTLKLLVVISAMSLLLLCLIYASAFGIQDISYYRMFKVDAYTLFVKIAIAGAAFFSLLLSYEWLKNQHATAKEYPVLLLFSTLGLILLVSSENLLAFYVSFELASLSMYVMAAYERDNRDSSEAGLKYFILGSLGSGMLLFGISLIYGFTGTFYFNELLTFLNSDYAINAGVITGLIFVLVAICFKISAVPFHMWTPDVYEGSPTPVVAFFATAPKVAVICFAVRLLSNTFGELFSYWQQIILFVSVASMLLGAFAGLVQTGIKRLIAYSSIGHVGYLLMGIAAGGEDASQSILIYLVIYVIMSLGLFACLMLVKISDRPIKTIYDLAGLSVSHPRIALCISILMFSMAGIPPFIGFFAKMFVFTSVMKADLVWLAVIGVLTSVIACFYYIRIIKIMYFDEQTDVPDQISRHSLAGYVLLASVAVNVFIINPSIIISPARTAVGALFP